MSSTIELFRRYGPQGVKARDCVHVAVMRAHNLSHIISVDRDFDRIPGIVRLDPLDLYRQRK